MTVINGTPWQHQSLFNNSSNYFGTVYNGNTLPYSVRRPSVVFAKNKIYLIGGLDVDDNAINKYIVATVGNDGVVGSWSWSSLGFYSNGAASVILGDTALILGVSSSATPSNVIKSGSINSTGDITWSTSSTTLPVALLYHGAVVANGKLHIISGYNSNYNHSATTYSIDVDSSGTVGSWQQGGTLPDGFPVSGFEAFVYSGRLYVVGGDCNGLSAKVFSSAIGYDGSLGSWREDRRAGNLDAMTRSLSEFQCVTTGQSVILIGGAFGSSGDTLTADVTTIPSLNFTGDLTGWLNPVDFGTDRAYHRAFVTSSRLYVVGGLVGESFQITNSVEYVAFSGGYNDYSAFINEAILNASCWLLTC